MKRLITIIFLIVVILVGFMLITRGLENDTFNIASFDTIESKSKALTKKLAIYDKLNQDEYESKINTLNSSLKSYKVSKEKYEEIVKELAGILKEDGQEDKTESELVEEIIYSDKEKYKVDFLLVTLGDYGEKEGVDVVYQLTTSSTMDPNATSMNYFLSDLKFTVTGEYMHVTNFISDLENDDKLDWEIRNFTMNNGEANGYKGVTAQFTIKDVPIDSESYLTSSGNMSTDMNEDFDNQNIDENNNNNNNGNNNDNNNGFEEQSSRPDNTNNSNTIASQNTSAMQNSNSVSNSVMY